MSGLDDRLAPLSPSSTDAPSPRSSDSQCAECSRSIGATWDRYLDLDSRADICLRCGRQRIERVARLVFLRLRGPAK